MKNHKISLRFFAQIQNELNTMEKLKNSTLIWNFEYLHEMKWRERKVFVFHNYFHFEEFSTNFSRKIFISGQQQQFHFAFGQRPFHFPADPLGFRMPPIGNCQSKLFFQRIFLLINFRLETAMKKSKDHRIKIHSDGKSRRISR